MAIQIYDLPESVNRKYALRQEEYDREVAGGNVTPGGRQEAAVAQASRVLIAMQTPPMLDSLLGTKEQSMTALFSPMPGWDSLKNFSLFSAPSLGSIDKRRQAMEQVRDLLKTIRALDLPRAIEEARALTAAIDATIKYDEEVSYIFGQMGSLTPG